MTLLLGSDSQESADFNSALQTSGSFQELPTPTFFQGSGEAVARGLAQSIATPALFAGDAIDPVLRDWAVPADVMYGTNLDGNLESMRQGRINLVNNLKPNPATTGTAGEILYGLASVLPVAVAGTLASIATGGAAAPGAAALVGATQGYASFRQDQEVGIDNSTALTKAAITGGFSALGVGGPAAVGETLLTKVLSGAAINTVSGGAMRGLTHVALANGGYHEMADQYRVFDGQAIVTDAILGSAFGALHDGGAKPSDIDAALTSNFERQYRDAAPGVPTDGVAAAAHSEAMDKAMEQVVNGEPVNIDAVMSEAKLIPRVVDVDNLKAMDAAIVDSNLPTNESMDRYEKFNKKILSDEDGKIIDLYHGTSQDFSTSEFNTNPDQNKMSSPQHVLGAWVTTDPERASSYAYDLKNISPDGGRVLPVHIALEKPYLLTREEMARLNSESGTEHDERMIPYIKLRDRLEKEGYDGVILEKSPGEKGTAYAVFHPESIRSRFEINPKEALIKQALDGQTSEPVNTPDSGSLPLKYDPEKSADNPDTGISAETKSTPDDTGPNSILGQIIADKPDMKIALENEDGTLSEHSLADLIKQSDDEIANADKGESLFQAAVSCFLRG